MRSRLLLLLLIGLTTSFESRGQNLVHPRHVGYFQRRDPDKLVHALTHDLKSDSEKVKAIHDWIASNIRYDVRKWLTFDYRVVSIKRVLRSGKAICLGYSQLFEFLCERAGITCVSVPGYDKDMDVDLGDLEYLDEHIWNAVYIDGKWKLVDVCWDAGGIEVTKRTFRGFFVHLFSGGKRDVVKYHPHFVHTCTDFYCMRSGNFFATDHLPLNPIWQLTYPTISIDGFEKDSSYYYKRYFDKDNPSANSEYEDERKKYLSHNAFDKSTEDGLAGYKFNHKNHYEPASSYFKLAIKALAPF